MGFLKLLERIVERIIGVLLKPTFDKAKFNAAIAHLHAVGAFTPKMLNDVPIKELTEETNKMLSQAVNKAIADKAIPHDMKRLFSQDVFLFSGFKTYCELKKVSALLLDDEGKIKPFSQFCKDAAHLSEAYNKNRLQAEYLFAAASAQQVANRVEIKKDGNRHDLRYRTTKIGKDGKTPLDIFRFNPDKQKVIFSPDHPYKPKGEEGKKVEAILASQISLSEDRTADFKKYKADKNYTDVQMNEAGGMKATHVLHNFDKERGHFEKEARDILFGKGYQVILEKELPDVGEKVIDGVRFVDGLLNGISYEQSSISGHGKSGIKNALWHAAGKKAEAPVLYFPASLGRHEFSQKKEEIMRGIRRFEGASKTRFKKIVIIMNEEVYEI